MVCLIRSSSLFLTFNAPRFSANFILKLSSDSFNICGVAMTRSIVQLVNLCGLNVTRNKIIN